MVFIEIIFLIIIGYCQFHYFTKSRNDIFLLRHFFPGRNLDSDSIRQVEYNNNVVEQIVIEDFVTKEFKEVISATNSYLLKNKGSADFNIIKSIADRSVDAQENKVSASVSIPLYLGLMGTFLGVILGLMNIVINGFNLNDTDLIIRELLGGVMVAMTVSLFGLALTTLLNAIFFRNAMAQRDINRNHYFNFLQAELLPNLDNNLYSALDQFKENIADFNFKFSKNLDIFDNSFNKNIENLKVMVFGMAEQITAVTENTSTQLEFLQELKKIGYNRMAEANIKVFEKIKESGPLLVNFIKEQQKLTVNLEQANVFSDKISALMNRVSNFEDGINTLGRDLQQSDLLGADLLNLVKKHLSAMEQKEVLINDYASKSNHEVETFLSSALERIKSLKSNIEISFEKAFDFDAEDNLMQNLKHLKQIDNNTSELNIKLAEKNNLSIENKVDLIAQLLTKMAEKQEGRVMRVSYGEQLKKNVAKKSPWYSFKRFKFSKNG